jgi:hypothetical protein
MNITPQTGALAFDPGDVPPRVRVRIQLHVVHRHGQLRVQLPRMLDTPTRIRGPPGRA